MKILIRGARVLDPASGLDAVSDVAVAAGRIVAIGQVAKDFAPNKLMDYMMAARPVLMAIDAGNDPVRDADCGLTVEPENPIAIAQGIKNCWRTVRLIWLRWAREARLIYWPITHIRCSLENSSTHLSENRCSFGR